MITASIKTYDIDKQHLITGKNGKILSLVLFENRDGKGKYGDDGFIVQGVTQEAREAGIRGPIIGNWRHVEPKGGKPSNSNTQAESEDDPSIPF
jgi:hypothetical protein